MSTNAKILSALREAYTEGKAVTINLNEASALTGSGLNIGGRTIFDDAFAALRLANPFRSAAREITVAGSQASFTAKVGNATNPDNPWGYEFTPNLGTPNVDTVFWQLPVRVLVAQLPVRTAVLSDVNNLQETLAEDLALEFSQLEAESMVLNNDQAGTTTTTTGGSEGLRGLDMYLGGSEASYGTSGTAITNGIHTIKRVYFTGTSGSTPTYDNMVAAMNSLPSAYFALPGTAWHMTPDVILTLRQLKDTQGMPMFIEAGDKDGAAVGNIFGFPVISNPYLSSANPIYLANWPQFLTIGDTETMTIRAYDQTQPGFITMFAEKRMVSTIRNPFAGVRMSVD
jgi:HK97 family phage major capsid protein